MENLSLVVENDLKPSVESSKGICRSCISTEKRVVNILKYAHLILDLTGINVSNSDGLPQWICLECLALLQKAINVKYKMTRANELLYEYSNRCAPFPIDAQDPELNKYTMPYLSITKILTIDKIGKSKLGFHKVLQHEKLQPDRKLYNIDIPKAENYFEETVKDEGDFSDFEDNITLEEIKLSKSKDDIDVKNEMDLIENVSSKKKSKRKKDKIKKKKKECKEEVNEEDTVKEPKTSLRKQIELDPTKIRVINLNPEEQIKQREEASKASLKFPYQCHLCFKGFNFESKLQNHMTKHSPNRGPYSCELCQMYLPTAFSLSVHSLIHTRRFECVECGRRMLDRASILDHYRTQHEGIVQMFTCQICGKISNNNKTHRGHMRNHHSGERPECDQCGKTFVNKDSLAAHLQIHEGIKNYECAQCGMRFRTRTQIKYHQLKHTDVKEFYCVECDVRFKSAYNLRQHLKKSMKHKDKNSFKFSCSRCPLRFESSPALARHVAVRHEGARPHRCAACRAALASAASLRKHQRTVHAAKRPPKHHRCKACGKAFRGKSVLTNHIRTHTGEKPFSCNECGRRFAQRASLRTHIRLVHLRLKRNNTKLEEDVQTESKLESIMFAKEETQNLEIWGRQAACDVFFQVPAP